MFTIGKKVRSAAVLAILAGVCTAVLTVPGCGSTPGRVKWNHDDPWTGHSDGEYVTEGPPSVLPPGWVPDGERTVDITVDGKTYRIRLCVARNASNPNCIYINTGGCAARDGWQMYCRDTSAQQFNYNPPADSADFAPSILIDGQSLRFAKQRPVVTTDPSGCPDEWGSADYNMMSGVASVSFTTACKDEVIPTDLFHVTITGPDGVSLPAEVFSMVHNGIMPVGSTVEIQGSDNVVAWDCIQFHRPRMSFTSTDGQTVHAGIGFMQDGPPIAFVAVNGNIERTIAVTRPIE